jgi:cyclic pyranopterin phosphate synthase
MPPQGVHPEGRHTEYLDYDEIERIIRAFAELGVKKIRLTGGEPLVRKNLPELVGMLSAIPQLEDIALSTNAHYLERYAQPLADAGLKRINVSLDSLKPERFHAITRGGDLNRVLSGIEAAQKAGLSPVKINMVVMKGTNDDEIEAMVDFARAQNVEVRFIETMPIGSAGISIMDQHYSAEKILSRVKAYVGSELIPLTNRSHDGPARNYRLGGSQTKIGVISAVSQHFCETCNRVRLTARGVLALCLGQEDSVNLRDSLRAGISDDELKAFIIEAIKKKPERHFFNENIHNIAFREMVNLGG